MSRCAGGALTLTVALILHAPLLVFALLVRATFERHHKRRTAKRRRKAPSNVKQATMADPTEVAQGFVQTYYTMFGSDRQQLGVLYGPNSMLTFEDKQVQGAQDIVAVLAGLPFQSVRHVPKSIDAQPTVGNGIIVFVNGDIFIDGNNNPVKFSQVFNLQPNEGSFYVLNDLMRLNYG